MSYYFRHIDWPLVLFALLGGYLLPWWLIGSIASWFFDDSGAATPGASTWLLLVVVLPPILSGWFTVRFARELPRFQVGVVGVVGAACSVVVGNNPFGMALLLAAAVFALVCLGAFVRLRWHRNA